MMATKTKCKQRTQKTNAEDHQQHWKGETSALKQNKKKQSEEKTVIFPGPLMTAKMQKDKVMRFIRWKYRDCLLNLDKPEQQDSFFFWLMMELLCKENGRVLLSRFAQVLLKGYKLMKKKLASVENLEKWCVPLEQLLSTTASADVHKKKVLDMGDDFASRKWTYAAHICYVVAQIDLGSRKHFNVIGSEKSQSATAEIFERTEVYEYVLSLNSRLSQPYVQLFKFLHACELAKAERFAQAHNYCRSITEEVPRCKGYVKKSVEKLIEILGKGKKDDKWQKNLQHFLKASEHLAQLGLSPTKLSDFDSRYTVEELLRKEGHSDVYAGIRKKDKRKVAIKLVATDHQNEFISISGGKATLPREVALMKMVSKSPRCKNVVELLEWIETPTNIILVLEQSYPCIDLSEFINRNHELPEEVVQEIMWQVVQAVEHCYERGVLHRGIKPENLLINQDTLEVKLINFGCGDVLTQKPYTSYAGISEFKPPEWIQDEKYFGVPATIWSLGVLLCLMVSGSVPFENDEQIVNLRVPVPTKLSDAGKDLIEQCLQKNPDKRPNFRKIQNHKWFSTKHQEVVQLKHPTEYYPTVETSRCLAQMGFSSRQIRKFKSLYVMEELMSNGKRSSVYSGIRTADSRKVAIKCVAKDVQRKRINIHGEKASLPLEVALMKMVSKPPRCKNVVELLEWFETSTHVILVVRAAEHCYNRGVLHHDIKPDNILISPDTLEVKLIGFGCGDVLTDKPYRRYTGPLEFRPPEWILHKKYFGGPATIWGLGVLLCQLVSGTVPFKEDGHIVKGRVPVLSDLSPVGQNLMELCLEKDPDCRPSFRKIVNHQWFSKKPQDKVQDSRNPPELKKEKHRPSEEVSKHLARLGFSSRQISDFKSHYIMGELLGKGCYGSVYAAVRKADKKMVAIKCVNKKLKRKDITIPGEKASLPLEVALMKMVNKPPLCKNVVELLEWFETSTHLILVLERPSPCEDLFTFSQRYKFQLPEKVVRKVMLQVVQATEHCYKRGVLHNDIKSDNILVNPDTLEVKLIDFGCGDVLTDQPYMRHVGPSELRPPEWLVNKKYFGGPATIWYLGILLHHLVSGRLPFKTDEQIILSPVPVLPGLSDVGQNLLAWCLKKDPEQRPSLSKILNHGWFLKVHKHTVQISKNPPELKKDEKTKDNEKHRPSEEVSKHLAPMGFSSRQISDFESRYTMEELLGVGGYGSVYAGVRKADEKMVAIKCMARDNEELITLPGEKAGLPREVALMKMVSKPPCCENVVELLEWFETSTHLILVLDRPYPCKDLRDFCNQNNYKLTEEVAREVMWQVVRAAKHCCKRGVLHRDIKPENLLINPDTLEVKLIDFGCGDVLRKSPFRSYAGTKDYIPPEWFVNCEYLGVPATVWNLGIVLYELLTGDVPFEDEEEIVNLYAPLVPDLSFAGQELIDWCLAKNPVYRPSFNKILTHRWFMADFLKKM